MQLRTLLPPPGRQRPQSASPIHAGRTWRCNWRQKMLARGRKGLTRTSSFLHPNGTRTGIVQKLPAGSLRLTSTGTYKLQLCQHSPHAAAWTLSLARETLSQWQHWNATVPPSTDVYRHKLAVRSQYSSPLPDSQWLFMLRCLPDAVPSPLADG